MDKNVISKENQMPRYFDIKEAFKDVVSRISILKNKKCMVS